MRWGLLVMVGACGRLDFNPIGGNPNGDDDDDGHIDASFASHDAPIDALTACTNALPVQLNVRKATDTCAGGDLVDSCGPPATKEVVFAFTSPATAGYNFRAFDPGTQNVSSSLQQLDANCKPLGGCTGLLGISVAAGDTAYFVVEAAAGGCANIEFEAQ